MILIFGGTTEGRKAVAVCDKASQPFYYSTKSTLQSVESAHAVRLGGAMDQEALTTFCRENGIKLIVDAAHPFAEALHTNIAAVSHRLSILVIRYERQYPDRDNRFHWFDTYAEAISYLETHHIDNLLALSGVNTIPKLKPYWLKHHCWFRILDREESLHTAKENGFPADRILFYREGEDDKMLYRELNPGAILTKESGLSGGFESKAAAAIGLGIPLLVIRRPALNPSFMSVYGDHGLRREIERLVPGFFPLRTGLTSGTCATAATSAALYGLLTEEELTQVYVNLPNKESIAVPVSCMHIRESEAQAEVIKDAGDDPDVTNGMTFVSTVRLNPDSTGIRFLPGEGVGTVTLPGLGLEIGSPAINATPRAMMQNEVCRLLDQYGIDSGVDLTISVPGGVEIAAKTFNPKLGITGGISIIGTSGIIQPFSSDAFLGSIRREMGVARALRCSHLIVNSGAKSERFIRARYPDYPDQAFIHYGNFIGETLTMASEAGFDRVTLGIMIGKAVKLAEGAFNTHSKHTVMNIAFLQALAVKAGCPQEIVEKIAGITLVRELWGIIPAENIRFFSGIVQKCRETCAPFFHDGDGLEIVLIDEHGGLHPG